MSSLVASPDTAINEKLEKYFASVEETPSLAGFYQYDTEFFLRNSYGSSIASVWAKRFAEVAKACKVQKISKYQPEWSKILQELINRKSTIPENVEIEDAQHTEAIAITTPSTPASAPSRKRSRTSTFQSSKTDSLPLTDEIKKQFEDDFKAMESAKKWALKKDKDGNDIYLEDIMYSYGMECEYEHPVHSFIFDVNDSCWEEYVSKDDRLTKEDLHNIAYAGAPSLMKLDPSIQEIFDKCIAAADAVEPSLSLQKTNEDIIAAIWKAVTAFGFFDPVTHPDHEWLQLTILDYLKMYRNHSLEEIIAAGSELDYITRCWSNLDRCFENVATVGRDRTSVSTLVRNNDNRKVSGQKPIDKQQQSIRPDFLLIRDGVEYACGECGKDDAGGIGKKEIVERGLHVPKVSKDIFNRALSRGKNSISLARKIKVVALNENSTRMEMSILDCPGGYVCRLRTTDEYEIPVSPNMITAGLFPILTLTLQAKVHI
ncbi:hypothetical protein BJV82DRAFT_672876 [Fennellomyces sp. T-0311]|nr:hypothetical protein BJV82DRAFT_672876 [Fennellomyces sp. T-0311]